ncbi:hypothetical protein B0H10DRAFT_2142332 [Mycena sp. CBHHK59/15]|nr:hypothetical protein B0H10DRAFT_2142332 [Mycena sp. CBHHK59/15]
MALSFIGKPISLISHSDVRYRGILAGMTPQRPPSSFPMAPAEFIPPVQEPYQYIIFRASEVKDLAVDEPPPRRSVHDDPAVLGASTQPAPPVPAPAQAPSYAQQTAQQLPLRAPSQQQQQQQAPQQQPRPPAPRHRPMHPAAPPPVPVNANIHSAAASLETVERALGDLRVSSTRRRTKRPGPNAPQPGAAGDALPAADFDFASMNAKFDKAALAAARDGAGSDRTNPSDEEDAGAQGSRHGKEKEKDGAAYNPQKSFFDSLSSPPPFAPRGAGGRGRGRGGYGYNRREEERERNVATFGEPGGVGLLGPGAYVGGWGGYGGGGRRGGGRRRGPQQPVARPQE